MQLGRLCIMEKKSCLFKWVDERGWEEEAGAIFSKIKNNTHVVERCRNVHWTSEDIHVTVF